MDYKSKIQTIAILEKELNQILNPRLIIYCNLKKLGRYVFDSCTFQGDYVWFVVKYIQNYDYGDFEESQDREILVEDIFNDQFIPTLLRDEEERLERLKREKEDEETKRAKMKADKKALSEREEKALYEKLKLKYGGN